MPTKLLRATLFALLIGALSPAQAADHLRVANGHFDPKDVAAVEHALIESGQLDAMPDTSKYLTQEFLK
jgi:hypothetical protein